MKMWGVMHAGGHAAYVMSNLSSDSAAARQIFSACLLLSAQIFAYPEAFKSFRGGRGAGGQLLLQEAMSVKPEGVSSRPPHFLLPSDTTAEPHH